MLSNDVNIAVLSNLLGHASVQVTLNAYASVANELMMKNVKDLKENLKLTNIEFDDENRDREKSYISGRNLTRMLESYF